MLRTKTLRSRGGKARPRAGAAASAVKAKPKAPAAAEGSSPSGELMMQLEHVSFLSDRCPGAGLTRFEALLEEEEDVSLSDLAPPPPLPQSHQQPPPPPPMQEAAPMDADEPMEEKDICILSQDFFCTPDYITPEMPLVANEFDDDKENIPCPKSPEKSSSEQEVQD